MPGHEMLVTEEEAKRLKELGEVKLRKLNEILEKKRQNPSDPDSPLIPYSKPGYKLRHLDPDYYDQSQLRSIRVGKRKRGNEPPGEGTPPTSQKPE
jgi:hypothetical protein